MMNIVVIKRSAIAATLLGVIFGCQSVIEQITDEAANGGSGSGGTISGFATVESEFTDSPLSPGGTGGVVEDDPTLLGEETRSFFTAFQIDPEAEDTAGPKFVVAGDVDQDGLLDLVSGWNQSQPIQLHLQRRDANDNVSFRTVTLAGTSPVAVIAGVQLGQINGDGWLDVVVLAKASGGVGLCPTTPPSQISRLEGEIIVLFNPGNAAQVPDGDTWTEMILVNPFVQDRWIHNQFPGIETVTFDELKAKPENSGFTALQVGEIDGNPGDEIVVALNPGVCDELGQDPPLNTVDLWINPGPALAETSQAWGAPPVAGLSRGVPISIFLDAPEIKDILLEDIDDDGDLDIVAAISNSITSNIRWARNPFVPHDPGGPGGSAEVMAGFVDGFDTCSGGPNDELPCPNGDADCAGEEDGACLGGNCDGGPSDGSTCQNDGDCAGTDDGECSPGGWRFIATGWEKRPIGQVDTNADDIVIGDVDNDGFEDVIVRSTIGQIVQWFRRPNAIVVEPEFPPSDPTPDRTNFPWQVFTLTEYINQEPEAVSIGDLTGDGRNEVLIAAEGGVLWFDGSAGETVFDPWFPNTIIQDGPADTTNATVVDTEPIEGVEEDPGGTGVGVTSIDTSTVINALLVVDLDGDGRNDIVGTLDRRTGAGLSDDRLVWYRNTRTED